jgi:hypothetical protein
MCEGRGLEGNGWGERMFYDYIIHCTIDSLFFFPYSSFIPLMRYRSERKKV